MEDRMGSRTCSKSVIPDFSLVICVDFHINRAAIKASIKYGAAFFIQAKG